VTTNDEVLRRKRRHFLRAAGGAAVVLVASGNAFGQTAPAKPAERRASLRVDLLDRGIWATWYDLDEDGRDQYLSWLHGTYLPTLLKRPGYVWAAHYATRGTEGGSTSAQIHHTDDPTVPPGFRYILLVGAKDAFVFGDPVPSAIHAELPEEGKKMLAMRRNERVNLLTETGRCEGRARSAYKEGLMSAPSIQIGSFNCPVEYEEEMLGGYVQSRMPAMCKDASCVRTRKLNSVSGWAKHVILYEFTSVEGYERDYEATNQHAPIGLDGHSVVPNLIHAPHGPNSAQRIWPPAPKA
jgi:hypothetical protein